MQTIDTRAGSSWPDKIMTTPSTELPQEYRVCWEIDILAVTPEEAAAKAWVLVRGRNSTACAFTAIDEAGKSHFVDLLELAEAGNEA